GGFRERLYRGDTDILVAEVGPPVVATARAEDRAQVFDDRALALVVGVGMVGDVRLAVERAAEIGPEMRFHAADTEVLGVGSWIDIIPGHAAARVSFAARDPGAGIVPEAQVLQRAHGEDGVEYGSIDALPAPGARSRLEREQNARERAQSG